LLRRGLHTLIAHGRTGYNTARGETATPSGCFASPYLEKTGLLVPDYQVGCACGDSLTEENTVMEGEAASGDLGEGKIVSEKTLLPYEQWLIGRHYGW